jgi:hypothetical protein
MNIYIHICLSIYTYMNIHIFNHIYVPKYKKIPEITGIGIFPKYGRRNSELNIAECITNPVNRVSMTSLNVSPFSGET